MFVKGASSKYKIKAIILIVIGFVTMYCTGMFGTDIINVIQNPIMEHLGCSATSAVLGWSIAGYTLLVATYFFSTIIMKWGPHKFATLCLAIMAAGAALVGVGYSTKSVDIIAVGGILGASFALDNSTSSTGLTLLYNKLGFTGMITAGTVLMIVIGVLTFLFVRNTPEECGLTMDRIETEETEKSEPAPGEFQSKWTLGKLLSKKESWCVALTIHVFGAKEYRATNRYLAVIVNLIGACAVPFMTVLYDVTGGYALAYNILLVMNIVAFALMLICRKTYAED